MKHDLYLYSRIVSHLEYLTTHDEFGSTRRRKRETLDADQVSRLDSLGFVWNHVDERWESHFAALKRFSRERGHCRVPQRSMFEGLKLGQWVIVQRSTHTERPLRDFSAEGAGVRFRTGKTFLQGWSR